MNTEEFISEAAASGMKEFISPVDYRVNCVSGESYYVNCKMMLLGASEIRNDVNKIDYSFASDWWIRDQALVQEGTAAKQMYITPSDTEYIRTKENTASTHNLRPVFHLTRDYFIKK